MFGKEGAFVGQQLLHNFTLATSGLESAPPYKTAWDEKVGETGCKTQQDGWGGGGFGFGFGSIGDVHVIMGLYSEPYTIININI